MTAELVIAETVRRWAMDALEGDRTGADAAAALAVRRYAGGASVSEACREARRFVGSWSRHPSHRGRPSSLRIAS